MENIWKRKVNKRLNLSKPLLKRNLNRNQRSWFKLRVTYRSQQYLMRNHQRQMLPRNRLSWNKQTLLVMQHKLLKNKQNSQMRRKLQKLLEFQSKISSLKKLIQKTWERSIKNFQRLRHKSLILQVSLQKRSRKMIWRRKSQRKRFLPKLTQLSKASQKLQNQPIIKLQPQILPQSYKWRTSLYLRVSPKLIRNKPSNLKRKLKKKKKSRSKHL